MPTRPCLLLFLLCGVLLTGASQASRALPQAAYVWQRHWTPAVDAAMQDAAGLVQAWHILVAQRDRNGALHRASVDWPAVARSRRPAVLVLRIDGSADLPDPAGTAALLAAVRRQAQQADASVRGIEIDHDCATARLTAYAVWLTTLRVRLDPGLALSITALPSWTASADLPAVLAAVPRVVLQVHAVLNPRSGLFDPAVARGWIDAFAARSRRPFQVSLPTYGARVSWDADGELLGIESEMPLLVGGTAASELMASPRAVAQLLHELQRDPPATLAGIVWFRLPTAGDRRAWSPATWRAVLRGGRPDSTVTVATLPGSAPGLQQIALQNPDAIDALLPQAVTLPARCSVADGIGGYALSYTPHGLRLQRQQTGLLHGHSTKLIGWMRCDAGAEAPHVIP